MAATTLFYRSSGDEHPKTIVFIHGWPDDCELWRHQVCELEAHYRCVVVTLPNFGPTADKSGGYPFATLVEMLKHTIDEVQPSGDPVYLVTHDWGAYIGYLFEAAHPDRVERMVALDIGAHGQPTLKEFLMIIGYQWTLITGWLLGGVIPPLGNALSRLLGRALKLSAPRVDRIRSRFAYPYFHLWMDLLLPWRRGNLIGRYTPRCPVLFIHGHRKPVMFHSERWLSIVEKTGGRCERVDEGDHWFMETHPERVNPMIREWLPAAPVPSDS